MTCEIYSSSPNSVVDYWGVSDMNNALKSIDQISNSYKNLNLDFENVKFKNESNKLDVLKKIEEINAVKNQCENLLRELETNTMGFEKSLKSSISPLKDNFTLMNYECDRILQNLQFKLDNEFPK